MTNGEASHFTSFRLKNPSISQGIVLFGVGTAIALCLFAVTIVSVGGSTTDLLIGAVFALVLTSLLIWKFSVRLEDAKAFLAAANTALAKEGS